MKIKSVKTDFKVDEEKGEVEAFVSVFGNVDSYGDRVMYGAFKDSLSRGLPKVVWQHDLKMPIGKTILAEEIPAGDSRLPDHLIDNGALYVKGLLNLKTTQGRDAFEHIKFGSVDEYSFGYEEIETTPASDGAKELNKLEIIEWSPVTIGANPLTMTAGVKSLSLEEKINMAATLLDETTNHANAYVDMRTKAGRVLNSRIRSQILSLADQSKSLANELYALHKETEPIKAEDLDEKKRLLLLINRNIQTLEIL
jgi:HK97 family phage prohead protease